MKILYDIEKKADLKTPTIDLLIYPVSISVLFKKENDLLEGKYNWGARNDADALVQNFLSNDGTIALRFRQTTIPVSVLVHEATHIGEMVLHHIGHNLDEDDKPDEPLAYLVEYVVKEVLKIAKKQGVRFQLK